MKQAVKDYLNSRPRLVQCSALYRLSAGYQHEGGDYDAAQRWLAQNGYRYEVKADGWVKA